MLPILAASFLGFSVTLASAALVYLAIRFARSLFVTVPAVSVGPDAGDQLSVIGSPEGA